MQEGSLFIPSVLGPKSHPTQGNPTRAPNKGVWRLIYRQFFVSVTGVAGITWLARQDERISCLFLVNMTWVLETVFWSLTLPTKKKWMKSIPRHFQLWKIKGKILKETRERKNHLLHRGTKRNYIYLSLRNYASSRLEWNTAISRYLTGNQFQYPPQTQKSMDA